MREKAFLITLEFMAGSSHLSPRDSRFFRAGISKCCSHAAFHALDCSLELSSVDLDNIAKRSIRISAIGDEYRKVVLIIARYHEAEIHSDLGHFRRVLIDLPVWRVVHLLGHMLNTNF